MWKQLLEVFSKVITLAQRTDTLEQKVKNQEQELKELTVLVQWLTFELQRMKDEQRHTAEREASEREHAAQREASERKMFQLQIENQLLKFARQLPPRPDDNDDEDKG